MFFGYFGILLVTLCLILLLVPALMLVFGCAGIGLLSVYADDVKLSIRLKICKACFVFGFACLPAGLCFLYLAC